MRLKKFKWIHEDTNVSGSLWERSKASNVYGPVSTKYGMKGNYNCIFLGNLTTVSDC